MTGGWQPWKNGGGRTRTLATHPEGAGMEDFAWRISLAEIAAAGPFSAFAGVERLFTPVAGDPVRLTIDGETVPAGPETAPLRFDGAAEVHAEPTGGPLIVLNLMCRAPFRAEVTRGAPLPAGAVWQGVLDPATLELSQTGKGLRIGLYDHSGSSGTASS
ncbi:HutD/Ves family protein [Mangrovicoccus algicola]|uniref:HutD family protein n=1 Tax=Mangrovicoccus algicola TaxID=2771008 RepID=A0A8J6YXV2_9RHOB|nr:HutD family protein [Mangrovicoccus algicola]MBE3639685.1 HutD family protein [Mangrovicoccus algicola]